MIRQTFITRDTLDAANLKILVEYLEGPFSHLRNRWVFHPTGENTCEVEFFIEYEFRSRTLAMLMGAMFDTAFRKFAAAFEKRADQVYGTKRA
jgi:coenzyme Q-binding protein COQ10